MRRLFPELSITLERKMFSKLAKHKKKKQIFLCIHYKAKCKMNKKLKLKRFSLSLRGVRWKEKIFGKWKKEEKLFFAFLIQFSRDCCWSLLYAFCEGGWWRCVCYFIEHIINIISIILWNFLLLKSEIFFVLFYYFYIFFFFSCRFAVFQFPFFRQ